MLFRLLGALESVTDNIPIAENETSTFVSETTFAVSVQEIEPDQFTELNVTAVLGGINITQQRIDESALLFNTFTNEQAAGSLSLPSNLLSKTNGTRVTLTVFVTNSLFLRRESNDMKVGSIIIAAGVVGKKRVEGLNPPMVAVFQKDPVS